MKKGVEICDQSVLFGILIALVLRGNEMRFKGKRLNKSLHWITDSGTIQKIDKSFFFNYKTNLRRMRVKGHDDGNNDVDGSVCVNADEEDCYCIYIYIYMCVCVCVWCSFCFY